MLILITYATFPERSDGKGKKEKQNVTRSSEAELGAQGAYLKSVVGVSHGNTGIFKKQVGSICC